MDKYEISERIRNLLDYDAVDIIDEICKLADEIEREAEQEDED